MKKYESEKSPYLANNLRTTLKLIKLFLEEKCLNSMSEEDCLKFFKCWVKKRNKIQGLRPYRLNLMLYQVRKTIKFFLTDKKLVPVVKQSLKKLTHKLAKKLFTENNFAPKKANIFSLKEIEIIMTHLWAQGIPEKETSIMLGFNFLTGCRISDLKYANWKDIDIENNEYGRFLTVPLKLSKTNPMGLKTEQA